MQKAVMTSAEAPKKIQFNALNASLLAVILCVFQHFSICLVRVRVFCIVK